MKSKKKKFVIVSNIAEGALPDVKLAGERESEDAAEEEKRSSSSSSRRGQKEKEGGR